MELKRRILALDVGEKRIGLALSDPFGLTAQGLESYLRSASEKEDFEHIYKVASAYAPLSFLIGMPRNMNGSYGPQAEKIRSFAGRLNEFMEGKLEFELRFFDERLSTMAAERILIEADLSRKKRRKVIDKLAATVILQGYLDTMNNGNS